MPGLCPFQSGQRVQLHQRQTVRVLDRVDAPGRTVNVFTTTGASSYLTTAEPANAVGGVSA